MSGAKDESAEASSPVCYAREADPAYMGFANHDEMVAFLADLLASEQMIAAKLRAMLPKVRDEALYAGMKEKLATLDASITKTQSLLTR